MKPLSIRDALKLYKLLSPYVPANLEGETGLSFIGKIIDNIIFANRHRDYIEAVALMMGTTVEDIVSNLKSDEILPMFAEGLEVNKILFLQEFCKKVGIDGNRS